MAFHRRKLLLVSFSCGNGPMDITWVVLDDGAKREADESVVREPEVLARADEVVPAMAFALAR